MKSSNFRSSQMSNLRFVADMSNDDYHSGKGVSKTTLDMAAADPHRPEWSRKCPQDEEKIKTFDFGDAMHAICLEPERLKTEFVMMPPFNLRTNQGKEDKAAFVEEHKGAKLLSHTEHRQLNLMFESVMAHREARELIEADGIAEGSYFWTDEATGLECKCRPDKHIQNQSLLVDVKTTPSLAKFCYSVDDYRYYIQDPWYCDGVSRFGNPVRMEFLVAQKTIECGRYPVMVVKLPQEAIEYGQAVYREDLRRYAEFLSSGAPPATRELVMGYQFDRKAEEHFGEIF
jgi:exodeoxyribonuclease VIII